MSAPADAILLERYHAQPGKTPAMLGPFHDAESHSSYDLLAAEASGLPRDAYLLDLACGDGPLLALLASHGFEHLAGVDRSPEEIAAARSRLGPHVELHCEDAAQLPVPDDSVNAVLCHMALMLMAPVEPVLAEVARVLRPGGIFLAVINRRHPDPAFDVFFRELRRVTTEAGLERLRLGPADIFTIAGLRAHLSGAGLDEGRARIHDFAVRVQTTPRGLWPIFEAMYDVFRLPDRAKEALADALLAAWDALADDQGQLGAEMGMRLIACPAFPADRSP